MEQIDFMLFIIYCVFQINCPCRSVGVSNCESLWWMDAGGRVKFALSLVGVWVWGGHSHLSSGKASKTGWLYLHLNLTSK